MVSAVSLTYFTKIHTPNTQDIIIRELAVFLSQFNMLSFKYFISLNLKSRVSILPTLPLMNSALFYPELSPPTCQQPTMTLTVTEKPHDPQYPV